MGHPRSSSLARGRRTLVLSALVAAALWAAWLGWDNTYYRLPPAFPGDGGLHGPWTTAQVVGYAVMLMVIATVAVAAARWNPVATGVGMFVGTWVPFSIWALVTDDDGLAIIGIVLSAAGMGLGALLCSAIGFAIGHSSRRAEKQPFAA